MRAVMVMFDSLNRRMLSPYGCEDVKTPNFDRLAARSVAFDNCYVGSMPCMPARRELHTGRYNFLHRSWGPLEPFDDSVPEMLKKAGIYTHLASDHIHYWEDGGATYHNRYNSWEISRGQEGDLWKASVKDPDRSGIYERQNVLTPKQMKDMGIQDLGRQDIINRRYLTHEEDMPQAVTFRNGLQFLAENHEEDNWFLQIETFDPHEPFFVADRFKRMYPDEDYMGPEFDWPPYAKVEETQDLVEHCRNRYKALVSMCDYYLGTVLDAFDQYGLWDDTLLIVNTDHGFLLGEHGWWAKSNMPYYNEIANIPLFIYDPKARDKAGEHRKALVQNIDVAVTLLDYFGQKPTKDMQGQSLLETVVSDQNVHDTVIYGAFGGHVNITDGRYTYMRSPKLGTTAYEYTLMPTHMRDRFSAAELQNIELAEPYSFTKGVKTIKVKAQKNPFVDPARFGNLLFDLEKDPGQLSPIDDPDTEIRMINQIREQLAAGDAPEELYGNLGLSREAEYTAQDLDQERYETEHPTVKGLEGYRMDRAAYLCIMPILGMVPAGQQAGLIAGMRQALDAAGTKEITPEFLKGFFGRLPIPESMRDMMMGAIFGK